MDKTIEVGIAPPGLLTVDLTGKGRCLRSLPPPCVGRGLLAFVRGRGRGLRHSFSS